MSDSRPTPSIYLLPSVGNALLALCAHNTQAPLDSMTLEELHRHVPEISQAELRGLLSLLITFGLITEDKTDNFRVNSKYGSYALSSLADFQLNSIPVVDSGTFDERTRIYLTTITSALESIRRLKVPNAAPLHRRRIINVIITGYQIRAWRKQNVYLHVFHNKWKAYHLIGLGKKDKDAVKTDDQIAEMSLEIKLGLKSHQFELNTNIRPQEIAYIDISASHGALTEYTVVARVLKSINVNLDRHIQTLMTTNQRINSTTFRWFTRDEINQGVSVDGERIIQSTPRILNTIAPEYLKSIAGKVRSSKPSNGVTSYFSSHFTLFQLVVAVILLFLVYALIFQTTWLFGWLNRPSQELETIAQVSQIIGTIIAILTFIGLGGNLK